MSGVDVLDELSEAMGDAPAAETPKPTDGKGKPAAKAATKPAGKPTGETIRTADGKVVPIVDASPVGDTEAAKPNGSPSPLALAKLPVDSLVRMFDSAAEVATRGIRAHVAEYSDDDLQEIDQAARAAEATGWRMACSVRHEMVLRLRKRVESTITEAAREAAREAAKTEGKEFDESAAIAIDSNEIKKGLTEQMKALAEDMGIGWRDLYVSSQIEKTFFYDKNVDDDGNIITQDQIEKAVAALQNKRFLVEALRCKKPSPGYALLVLAEKKLAQPRYSTRDAAILVSEMNGGKLRGSKLAEDEEDVETDTEEEEGAAGTAEGGEAATRNQTLTIGRLSIPGMSGDAISFLQNVVDAVKKVEKNGSKEPDNRLYVFRTSEGLWTTSTGLPEPRIPLVGCVLVRPGSVTLSAHFVPRILGKIKSELDVIKEEEEAAKTPPA